MKKSNEPTKTKKAMKTIKFLSMAALALVGAVMTGCSNDDNIIDTPQQPENKGKTEILTTTVGFGEAATTRALTSGGVKTFAAGETMAVVYKNNSGNTMKAVSAALPTGDYGNSATFTFTLEDPDKTKPVMYIYPAAMAKATIATDATIDDANTVDFTNLNAQNGTLATLSSTLDLATYSAAWDGTSLPAGTLVNQLAVCALTLKDNATPTANTITSGLTQVTVSDGSNTYTVTPTGSNFGEVTIYVAIRPVTAALQYTATDGTKNYTKTATSREYAAGNFFNLGLRMLPAGALAGKFTINGSGGQVYFSKGNLQATYDGSAWSWAFATNQWDYIGNAIANNRINVNGTVSANGTVDLFGWVGASSTWEDAAQYGISNSSATNNTNGYGKVATEALKSDWGNTIGPGWRTLTKDEWVYLFNTRSASTVNSTPNARYAKAYLFGTKHGVILFPDSYTHPNGVAAPTGINATNNTSWNANSYSAADWAKMEVAGCVFLPAAGFRTGSMGYDAGSNGDYWSSSPHATNVSLAYRLYFSSGSLDLASDTYRYYGHSVRLVYDAN